MHQNYAYNKRSFGKKLINFIIISLLVLASFSVFYIENVKASPDVAPYQTGESPTNTTTGINTTPELFVLCRDNDTVDTTNATWMSNSSGPWVTFATNTNIANNTNISQINGNFSSLGAKYWWCVNLTDGSSWSNATYHFTTNEKPWLQEHSETPANTTTNICPIPTLYVVSIDNNSDTMTATWKSNTSGPWVTFAITTGISSSDNISAVNNNFTASNTKYWWCVNLTDGCNWSNATYHFTTNQHPTQTNPAPTSGLTNITPQPTLYVVATDPNSDTMSSTWNSNSSGSWVQFGTTTGISTGTNISKQNTNFSTASTKYWWSVNLTDGCNWTNATYSLTINNAPTLTNEAPTSGSTNVSTTPALYVVCSDSDSDVMAATWWYNDSNNWWQFATNSSINTGTNITQTNGNFSNNSATYYWSVNLTDGKNWTNATYSFTTNDAPTQTGLGPTNGSKMNITTPPLFVTCTDSDSNVMTATWYSNSSGSWVLFGTNNSVITGTNITQTNSNFSSNVTNYWWSVNLTDGTNWTNATYKIRGIYNSSAPSNFSATASSTSAIALSWTKATNASNTYIEWKSSSSAWARGGGTLLYNGTGASTSHTGLSASTIRYYQAWSYNVTDNYWSTTNSSDSATTSSESSSPGSPGPSSPLPSTDDSTTTVDTTNQTTTIDGNSGSANDTDGDGTVDSFEDPDGILTDERTVNMSGNITFLITANNSFDELYLWDTTANTTVEVTHNVGTVTDTVYDTENDTVTKTITVNKSDWIYIELDDQYPSSDLIVQTSDGRIISSDMIWRENGKIYVLDDPDTIYKFIYGYTILDPTFNPTTDTVFELAKPTITITYQEEVNITVATFGDLDIIDLITTTDDLTFTYAADINLTSGTYVLSITAQDSDENNLTSTASYTIQLPSEDDGTPSSVTTPPDEGFPWYLIVIAVITILMLIIVFLFKIGYLYVEDASDPKKKSKKKK